MKPTVDLHQLEELLASPDLTMNEVGARIGLSRHAIYHRKDREVEFGEAFRRGLQRREQECFARRQVLASEVELEESEEQEAIGICGHCERSEAICIDYRDQECNRIRAATIMPCVECSTDVLRGFSDRTMGHCGPCWGLYLSALRKKRIEEHGTAKKLCVCGRAHDHGGRCAARRRKLAFTIKVPVLCVGEPTIRTRLAIRRYQIMNSTMEGKEFNAQMTSLWKAMRAAGCPMCGSVRKYGSHECRRCMALRLKIEHVESEIISTIRMLIEAAQRPLKEFMNSLASRHGLTSGQRLQILLERLNGNERNIEAKN